MLTFCIKYFYEKSEKTVDNKLLTCYYVNKVEAQPRKVTVHGMTSPMVYCERQGCRRTVSGKFRSGCISNRYMAVIIPYDGELLTYQFTVMSTFLL